ncbi:MAG: hypothetical protein HYU66_11565 [Armatimonadetes bacterium]|nr:hypothetical protein [Armatimonadota bacterium]
MQSASPADSDNQGLTARFPWRGLLVGELIEVPTIYWVAASEVTARVFISSWSLTMTAVFVLLVLLAVNGLLQRWRPAWVLSRADLLTVFVMLSSTSVIYGYCMIQGMIPSLGGAYWFASEPNHWETILQPSLPAWAFLSDQHALRGMFEGYATVPWAVWLPKWLFYGAFLLSVYAATLGLCQLLARQWISHEKLTFPICALPLEMTSERWSPFRSKVMWVGFAIPMVLETLLALHFWFPAVPAIPMKHALHPEWFPTRPWSVLRPLWVGWTPFIVGLCYVAPTEISFACWFFPVFNFALRVVGAIFGWTDAGGGMGDDFPYLPQLNVGGFLAFASCSLYMARRHLAHTLHAARHGGPDGGYYRVAYLLWLGGSLGVMLFCLQLGMRLPAVVGVFSVYFLVILTVARERAEAGQAWAFGPDRPPQELLVWLVGSTAFDRQSLVGLGMLGWFFIDVRFATLPCFLESLKTGHEAPIRRSHLTIIILVSTLAAVGFGMAAVTGQYYALGAATAKTYGVGKWIPQYCAQTAVRWITQPTSPAWRDLPYVALGGVIVTVLHLIRQRVLWWPFHPVGFVWAHTGTGRAFIVHYFVAWLSKTVILRAGGMKLYRRSLPFVLGVILGDIATQTAWSLLATLCGWPVYQFVS